ncbi:MAG: DNA primase [Bacteroidales bacterium]|nr:DNA primase [Bacteroidales bacterium]
MIDQLTIDRILNAAKIVDVVSEFVTLRKRGANFIGLCPFHNERTPSFSVSQAKGICKCFSCGKGGNVIHFVMEHEQLSYYEAARWLAKKYGIEIEERELTNKEKEAQSTRESMFILNSFAKDYYMRVLTEHIEGKSVGMGYFRERGFRDDIIHKFQLGYSTEDRDALAREALKSGFKKELLIKTGLCTESEQGQLFDRYRERVIFPILSLSGKVVAFGGRILKKNEKLAKYVNSPESEVYHKSNELYGIFFAKQAIVKQDLCYLVEGYTDVLSMHQAGVENVVASSGTALTGGQIRLIHRFTDNICVLYDGDAAGIKASIRGIDLLLEEGLNVKVVLLPDGEDPDSFAHKLSATEFTDYLKKSQTDFIRFKTTLLLEEAGKDPIRRATLISDIVKSISLIPDQIIRSVYVKECSQMLQINEELLHREVNKLKLNQLEKQQNATKRDASYIPPFTPSEEMPQLPEDFRPAYIPGEEPAPQQPVTNYRYAANEKELIRVILKYGEVEMGKEEDDEDNITVVHVCDYIKHQMDSNELAFENPMYQQMMMEAWQGVYENPSFVCMKYFMSHQDAAISRLAADLLSERFVLSKYHTLVQKTESKEVQIVELVSRVTMEYLSEVLNDQMKNILEELKQNVGKDPEREAELMREMCYVNEVKAKLSKSLGERIILK